MGELDKKLSARIDRLDKKVCGKVSKSIRSTITKLDGFTTRQAKREADLELRMKRMEAMMEKLWGLTDV